MLAFGRGLVYRLNERDSKLLQYKNSQHSQYFLVSQINRLLNDTMDLQSPGRCIFGSSLRGSGKSFRPEVDRQPTGGRPEGDRN